MISRNRLMRKSLSFLLVLVAMLTAMCVGAYAAGAEEDGTLELLGIDYYVVRADAAQQIYDYFNWSHHDEYNDIWAPEMDHFTDVTNGSANYLAIECALQQGIVPKTEEFRPGDDLTYGEATYMLTRAFGVSEEDVTSAYPEGWTEGANIRTSAWNAAFAHLKNDFVSPVQALPIASDINGGDAFAPRRYLKFWTPTEGTTIYFQKTYNTTGYDDDFELDIANAKDDQPGNHASSKSGAVGQTQIYTVEDDGHIKEDYTSNVDTYVSYKVVAVDAEGNQSPVRTYHYHLHRPPNNGTGPESGYHVEKVLDADAVGEGSPEVWQICRDAESLRAMAWYIKGDESGIVFDALQQKQGSDGGWAMKTVVDQLADGQPYVVVIGHVHPDHAAQASYFADAGIPIYVNERGWGSIGGYLGQNAAEKQKGIINIDMGDQLSVGATTFDVYALPGHTDDLVILADRVHGLVFATDIYGCTRAGSADNVSVSGVAADLLLSMAVQLREDYERLGTPVQYVFTGHDELPLDRDVLLNFEKALQNIVDYGNAAFTPTLRGGNNGFHAPTSLVGDMWKDYKNWLSLQTGNLSSSKNLYMSLTAEDAALNADLDYQDPGNKAANYSNETHSYDISGTKFMTYSVLSNVEVEGARFVGVDLVFKSAKSYNWLGERRTAPCTFHDMFNPWHYAYDIMIEEDEATISVLPEKMSSKAKITGMTLDGAAIDSLDGLAVHSGSEITVTVTAQDKVTTSTYTFTVLKEGEQYEQEIESIQATVEPSFYGYKVGKVEIAYKPSADLSGVTDDTFTVYDRGFNNPLFGALKVADVSVNGSVVTLTMDDGTDKVTDRSRETYGTLCTSSNWFIDKAGDLYYGKGDPVTDQLGITFKPNTVSKGLQWRENLDLILCIDGQEVQDGIASTNGLGKWLDGTPWQETILGGDLDKVELKMVDIGREAGGYTLLGDKGEVPVYVIFPDGYDASREQPYPTVIYQCGGGVCYWEFNTADLQANNLGCNVIYDTMMTEWHRQWPEAIVMGVDVHSTVEVSATEIVDVLHAISESWNIDTEAITIVGNSQGTLIASDVIRQAPELINAYVECNGNFGVMASNVGTMNKTLANSSLGKWSAEEVQAIVDNGVSVWMFNGETDGANPVAQQDVIEVYKQLLRNAGKGEKWIDLHVRASGLQSWQFKAWGETDHSVTKVVAWNYLAKPYNNPNAADETLDVGATYRYAGKEEGYANYQYTLGYDYKVYAESVAEWAKAVSVSEKGVALAVTGAAGDGMNTVGVEVTVKAVRDLGAVILGLDYDDGLELKEVKGVDWTAGDLNLVINEDIDVGASKTITLIFAAKSGVSVDPTVKATVLAAVGKDEMDYPSGLTASGVGCIVGDANGDGRVLASDLVRLRNYIGSNGEGVTVSPGADINGDGAVTGLDLTALNRYFATTAF